jgi:hypothetical protein
MCDVTFHLRLLSLTLVLIVDSMVVAGGINLYV